MRKSAPPLAPLIWRREDDKAVALGVAGVKPPRRSLSIALISFASGQVTWCVKLPGAGSSIPDPLA
jgi:hypothetical protein